MNHRQVHVLVVGILIFLAATSAQARIEPVGVWSCVAYGKEREEDERMLLDLRADGSTWLAWLGSERYAWVPLSQWERRRGQVLFSDVRSGREYQADLDYPALGGIWTGVQFNGGWWCAPLEERPDITPEFGQFDEQTVMPHLVVDMMASPWYPRRAIWTATEGYAVVCFHVKPDGFVTDPHFLELSDEVFELPAMGALQRSHYRKWDPSLPNRAACRTFDFFLEGDPY